MKRLLLLFLLTTSVAWGQAAPCLILWRQNEVRRILGHDTIVRHWRLIEGEFPASVKPTSHVTDKTVRKVKAAGGKVVEVPLVFTQEDLAKARQQCREETK